jgi:hypothetical protein
MQEYNIHQIQIYLSVIFDLCLHYIYYYYHHHYYYYYYYYYYLLAKIFGVPSIATVFITISYPLHVSALTGHLQVGMK